jgi:serine/threonine protein kinase
MLSASPFPLHNAYGSNVVASLDRARHIVCVEDLHIGAIVGHYKILRYLGEGGMGVAYEAEDLKLGRRVALKFLSKGTMKDHATLERFWREARTASALNHPSICTVHELNESTDPPFLVMELVTGRRLDKLCSGSPIPPDRLINLAIQIGEALACAHHQGILHRDIKPSNIVVGDSDRAKLLDFGLAKRMELSGELRGADPNQATVDHQDLITGPGVSPGTIAHMSPEQARGEELDCRTDIFSFGIMLYLMATGIHPFQGGTPALVTDRLLHQTPVPPHALNFAIPADLGAIIQKALEKDRDLRYQSTADLLADMKRIQRDSGNVSVEPVRQTSVLAYPRTPRIGIWVMLAALLSCSVAGYSWYVIRRSPAFSSLSVLRITDTGDVEDVALFPDGRTLAEVKSDGPQYTLWVRNIPTDTEAQVLSSSSLRYLGLTVSPDGNRLYFVRQDPNNPRSSNLYSMSVLGGNLRQLLQGIDGPVSFSPDGKKFIYVRQPKTNGFSSEVHVADAEGDNDELLTKNPGYTPNASYSPDGSEVAWVQLEQTGPILILFHLKSKHQDRIALPDDVLFIHRLAWLPDGKHLLLNGDLPASNDRMFGQFAVMTLPSGEFRRITNDTASYHGLTLSADPRTIATLIIGKPSRIDYFRSSDGTLLTSNSSSHWLNSMNWIDEKHLALLELSGDVSGITIADRDSGKFHPIDAGKASEALPYGLGGCSDGQLIFVGRQLKPPPGVVPQLQLLLYRIRADGTEPLPLAGTEGASAPVCSRDNQLVHYAISKEDGASAWETPLQGGTPHKLFDLPPAASVIYSSNGKLAAYTDPSKRARIITVEDLAAHKILHKIELKDYVEGSALHFSRDDKAIAYIENLGNELAVIYQPIDGSPSHVMARVGHELIGDFAWSPSGKELAVLRRLSSSDIALISDTTRRFGR